MLLYIYTRRNSLQWNDYRHIATAKLANNIGIVKRMPLKNNIVIINRATFPCVGSARS